MTTQTLSYTCPHCNTSVDVMPRAAEDVVICPAPGCGKPFQVHIPKAAPADKLVLPEQQENVGVVNEIDNAANPPIAESLNDKEEEVQKIHLHMFRRYPFRFTVHVMVMVAGLILSLAALANGWWLAAILCGAIAAFAAFRLTKWWLRMRHTTLTLTTKRCILESGVLVKETTEIPLSEVAGIQINQGFLTRLLNIGDLVIQSDTGEKKQFVFMAIPNPKQVATLIHHKGEVVETPNQQAN